MKRRRWLSLAAGGAALASVGCASAKAPGYRVSLRQLQDMLAQRFPARYPVAGLFDVDLDTPRLHLLPDLNRLGSAVPLRASGAALRRSYAGEVDLDFGLRYEPSDRSIRAHHVRIESLHFDGLAGDAQALIESSAAELVRQAMVEVVLHRLGPKDLALPDAMGLQPGPITVTWDGLLVEFVNKPAS